MRRILFCKWVMLALSAGHIVSSAGCGSEAPSSTCTTSNCAGCCSNGQCLPGNTDQVCGVNGGGCAQCLSGISCQSGECKAAGACTTGCRDAAGSCSPGNTPQACGVQGKTCVVCNSGETCNAGICQKTCNHLTCPDGCCGPTGCNTKIDNAACGAKGSVCTACPQGKSCVQGQCVDGQAGCTDCKGCCYEGACLAGDSTSTCGTDGEVCKECPPDHYCSKGICTKNPTQCDASNCNGCCSGDGFCIPFNLQSNDACGKGGEVCNTCSSSTTCKQGSCIYDQPCFSYCSQGCCTQQGQCLDYTQQSPQSCGDEGAVCTACDPNLSCLGGQCVADPVWDISVISAVVSDTDSNGNPWDSWFGTPSPPDPFVILGLDQPPPAFSYSSSSIDDTTTPYFNEKVASFLQSDLLAHDLTIVVKDDDGLSSEEMGSCTYRFSSLQEGDVEIAPCSDHVYKLTLRFTRQ
jgi:hypothetical protein